MFVVSWRFQNDLGIKVPILPESVRGSRDLLSRAHLRKNIRYLEAQVLLILKGLDTFEIGITLKVVCL